MLIKNWIFFIKKVIYANQTLFNLSERFKGLIFLKTRVKRGINLGQIKHRDIFRSTNFNVLRKVEIDLDDVPQFFAHIQDKLELFGWTKVEEITSDPDVELNSLNQISDLHEMVIAGNFVKNPWQILTVGMKVSNSGVFVAWDQRIHPRLAKLLGFITASTLLFASILRMIFPLGNFIPLLVFIFGTFFNLGVIMYAMYRFENAINKQDDIGIAFLESVLKYEGQKLPPKKTILNLTELE